MPDKGQLYYQLTSGKSGKVKTVTKEDFDANHAAYADQWSEGSTVRMVARDGKEWDVPLRDWGKAVQQGSRGWMVRGVPKKQGGSASVNGNANTGGNAPGTVATQKPTTTTKPTATATTTAQAPNWKESLLMQMETQDMVNQSAQQNKVVTDAIKSGQKKPDRYLDQQAKEQRMMTSVDSRTREQGKEMRAQRLQNEMEERAFEGYVPEAMRNIQGDIQNTVDTAVSDIFKEAKKDFSSDLLMGMASDDAVASGIGGLEASRERNLKISPTALQERIENIDTDALAKQLFFDNNGKVKSWVEQGAKKAGMTTEQYVRNVGMRTIGRQLQASLAKNIDDQYKVKSYGDYLMKKVGESFVGQIGQMFAATKEQNQMRAQAMAEYEEGLKGFGGWLQKAGGFTATMFGDLPLMTAGGKVGELGLKGAGWALSPLGKVVGKAAGSKIVSNTATKIGSQKVTAATQWLSTALPKVAQTFSPIVERMGSKETAARYEQWLMANLSRPAWLGREISRGMVSQTANMGSFMGTKGAMSQLTMGDDNSASSVFGAFLTGAEEGVKMGAAMGTFGWLGKLAPTFATRGARFGAKLGAKGLELGAFVGLDAASWDSSEHGGKDWSWTDSLAENGAMIVGFGLAGKILHGKNIGREWRDLMHGSSVNGLKLNASERNYLKGLFPDEPLFSMPDFVAKDAEGWRTAIESGDQASVAKYRDMQNKFVQLITDKENIPWAARQKMGIALFSTAEAARPIFAKYDIEGKRVMLRAKDGELIDIKEFKNGEDVLPILQGEEQEATKTKVLNLVGQLSLKDGVKPEHQEEVRAILEDVCEKYGIRSELFLERMYGTRGSALKDAEVMALDEAHTRMQDVIRKANEGKNAPEASEELGRAKADEVDLTTDSAELGGTDGNGAELGSEGTPGQQAIAEMTARENELSARWGKESVELIQVLEDKGITDKIYANVEAEDVMRYVNDGLMTEEEGRRVLDIIANRNNLFNATAELEAFVDRTAEKINEAVEMQFVDMAHNGSVDGKDSARGFVAYATDGDGRTWIVTDGSIDTRSGEISSESGMVIVRDAMTGEIDFKSPDELKFSAMEDKAQWTAPRIQELQERIDAAYGLSEAMARNDAELGGEGGAKAQGEGAQGEGTQGEGTQGEGAQGEGKPSGTVAPTPAEGADTPTPAPEVKVPDNVNNKEAFKGNATAYNEGKIEGNADSVRLADGTRLDGHYVLVGSDRLVASHDAETFKQREGAPQREGGKTMNDRDYENDKMAQQSVRQHASAYDERAIQDMPVVTKDGIVVSGNDRTMSGQLAGKNGTDAEYTKYLLEHAEKFGFTREQVQEMIDRGEHPRVVLELDKEVPYTTETYAQFNKTNMKKRNFVEEAVAQGKVMKEKPELVGKVTALIEKVENLSDLYGDEDLSKDLVQYLVDEGVISKEEVAEWLNDEGMMSDIGKKKFETLMTSIVLDEDAIRLLNNPDYKLGKVRQNIAYSIVELMKNQRMGEYSLLENINKALELFGRAKGAKAKTDRDILSWLAEADMFTKEAPIDGYTDEEIVLALNMSKGQRQFKAFIKTYNDMARDAANGQTDMFAEGGIRTKEQIIKELAKTLGYDNIESIREQRARARAQEAEGSKTGEPSGESPIPGNDEGGRRGEGEKGRNEGSEIGEGSAKARTEGTEGSEEGKEQTLAEQAREAEALRYKEKNPLSESDIDKFAKDTDSADLAKDYLRGEHTDEGRKAYEDIVRAKAEDREREIDAKRQGSYESKQSEVKDEKDLDKLEEERDRIKSELDNEALSDFGKAGVEGRLKAVEERIAEIKKAEAEAETDGKASETVAEDKLNNTELSADERIKSVAPLTKEELEGLDIPSFLKGQLKVALEKLENGQPLNDMEKAYLIKALQEREKLNNNEDVRTTTGSATEDSTDADEPQLAEGSDGTATEGGRPEGNEDKPLDNKEDGSDGSGEQNRERGVSSTPGEGGNSDAGEAESKSDGVSSGSRKRAGGSRTRSEGSDVRESGRDKQGGVVSGADERAKLDAGIDEKKKRIAELAKKLLKPKDNSNDGKLSSDITGGIATWLMKQGDRVDWEVFGQFSEAVLDLGHDYLRRAVYDFKEWSQRIFDDLGETLKDAFGWSDEEVKDYIKEMWNSHYEIDGETHTLKDWSSIIGKKAIRAEINRNLDEVRQKQKAAEDIEVKVGDRDNIDDTLPFLLKEQRDDVLKAETQFFDKSHADDEHGNGKGMLFTNGTGTGKTYTGLGIVKRFVKQGKGRVLIVTPTQEKVTDWKNDGKNLGLDIYALGDDKAAKVKGAPNATADKGRGVIITTYANMRANKALMEDVFDLIVYDESHRIMENKQGQSSATTDAHHMLANRDYEAAVNRMTANHPLWIKQAELLKEQKNAEKNYEWDRYSQIEQELKDIEKQQAWVRMGLLPKAAEAYQKTKVLFLSATPFNTRESLDYAESYLFKYAGDELERETRRNNFLTETFPSAYVKSKGKASQQISDEDAVTKEELSFADRLIANGVMSGRTIDNGYDYSRDFPTCSVRMATEFNQAVEEVMKVSNPFMSGDEAFFPFGDYQRMSVLFETMKIAAVRDRIQQHLDQGRKIIIFHRRVNDNKGYAKPPFAEGLSKAEDFARELYRSGNSKDATKAQQIMDAVKNFRNKYAGLLQWEQSLNYDMPRAQLQMEFGGHKYTPQERMNVKNAADTLKEAFDTNQSDMVVNASARELARAVFGEADAIGYVDDMRPISPDIDDFPTETEYKKAKKEYDTRKKEYDKFRKTALSAIQDEIEQRVKAGEIERQRYDDGRLIKKVGYFAGSDSNASKHQDIEDFNSDDSEMKIIVVQEQSGKEGISLHDTTGKSQRVMMSLALPQSPITFIQAEGRNYRIGNKSNAIFEYPLLGINQELALFAQRFNGRAGTTENLALGSLARGLKNSIARGVLQHSGNIPIGQHTQGIGGKEFDQRADQKSSPYDQSIQDWKEESQRRGDGEHDNTPEPLGFKMVEWAQINDGEQVLEPSAGDGSIARYFPSGAKTLCIEPDGGKYSRLALMTGGVEKGSQEATGRKHLLVNGRFEDLHAGANKADVIIMNAPVKGTDGRPLESHIEKALTHLRNSGRIIVATDATRTLKGYTDANTSLVPVAEVILPGEFANGIERIYIVDKVDRKELREKMGEAQTIDLSDAKSAEELFEKLRDVKVPQRTIDSAAKHMNLAEKVKARLAKNNLIKNNRWSKSKEIGISEDRVTIWLNDGAGNDMKFDYWYQTSQTRGYNGYYPLYYETIEKLNEDIPRLYEKMSEALEMSDAEFKTNVFGDTKYGFKDHTNNVDDAREIFKAITQLIRGISGKTHDQIIRAAHGENIFTKVSVKKGDTFDMKGVRKLFEDANGGDEEYQKLFDKVMNVAEAIGMNDMEVYDQPIVGRTIIGQYVPSVNRLRLNASYWNSKEVSDKGRAEVMLHELTHSVTSYAIYLDETGRDLPPKLKEAVNELRELQKKVKDMPGSHVLVRIHDGYMFENLQEFVAEGSANPVVRETMQKMGLWTKFKNAIKKFFAFDAFDKEEAEDMGMKQSDALAEFDKILDKFLENFDQESYDKYIRIAEASNSSVKADNMVVGDESLNNAKKGRIIPEDVDKSVSSHIESKFNKAIDDDIKNLSEEGKAEVRKDVDKLIDYITDLPRENTANNDGEEIPGLDELREKYLKEIKEYDKEISHLNGLRRSGMSIPNEFIAEKEVRRAGRVGRIRGIDREIAFREARLAELGRKYGIDTNGEIDVETYKTIFRDHNEDKAVGELFDSVIDSAIELGTKFRTSELPATETLALYAHKGGKIHIDIAKLVGTRFSKQDIATNMLQEILHPLSSDVIRIYEMPEHRGELNEQQQLAAQEILDAHRELVGTFKENGWDLPYALSNAREMLAELAKPEWRLRLKSLPDGGNIFKRIINAVVKMFGKGPVFNQLDKVSGLLQKAMDVSDRKIFDWATEHASELYNGGQGKKITSESKGLTPDDKKAIDELNSGKTKTVYRAMQVIDGKLYPPMAAKVGGKLVEGSKKGDILKADEHPEMIKMVNGKPQFVLDKGGKDATGKTATSVPARYNPYWHTSNSALNDQFKSAWIRPNMVVVECEIPESELTSGYKAQYAKDAVGMVPWKSGVVTNQLVKQGHPGREVYLSRYCKIGDVLTDAQAAEKIKEFIGDKDVEIPVNTVTPKLRAELEKLGVKIGAPEKGVKMNEQIEEALERGLVVDNSVRYRTADSATMSQKREPKQIVHEAAQDAVNALGGKGFVHESKENLPPVAQKALKDNPNAMGFYDPKTGEVHVFSFNCPTRYEAERTVQHEKIAHEGLRGLFGEEGYKNFMRQLWTGMDAETRKEVLAKAQRNGWDFYTAMDELMGEKAEDFGTDDKSSGTVAGFWGHVKDTWNAVMRGLGFKTTMTEQAIREALWLSKNRLENKTGNLEYKIRKAAFDLKNKKHVPMEKVSKDGEYWGERPIREDNNELRFRTMTDEDREKIDMTPSGFMAERRYNEAVSKVGYLWTEGHQNNLRSLQILQESICGKGMVKDTENAFMALNQLGSKDQQEQGRFQRELVDPLTQTMRKALTFFDGKKAKDRAEKLEHYVYAKHGLERNRVLDVRDYVKEQMKDKDKAVRDAAEKFQSDFDDLRKKLRSDLDNGTITLADYFQKIDDFIKAEIPDWEVKDRSGLSDGTFEWVKAGSKDYDDADVIAHVMDCEAKMGKDVTDELWQRIADLSQFAVQKDYDCGQMNSKAKRRMETMFDWYVPLRGFHEDMAEDVWGYFNEQGSYVGKTNMTAKGRISRADNPLATLVAMGDAAILRGNRNMAKMALVRLARNHTNSLLQEFKVQYRKTVDAMGNEVLEPTYPKLTEDMSADKIEQAIKDYYAMVEKQKANGEEFVTLTDKKTPYRVMKSNNMSQHFINVKINGKDITLVVKSHPRAAQAVNGLVRDTAIIPQLKTLNSFMSQLATSRSLTFMARNAARDFGFASASVLAKEDRNYAWNFLKMYGALTGKAWGNAGTSALTPSNVHGMMNSMANLFSKYRSGSLDMNNEVESYFKEYVDNGGVTGYVQMKGVDTYKEELEASIADALEGGKTAVAKKTFKKILTGYFDIVETVNEAVENQARFAAYYASRKAHRSITRSVSDAKEVSVNFNKTGGGNATKTMKIAGEGEWHRFNRYLAGTTAHFMKNTMWFYNAGIQGMSRTMGVATEKGLASGQFAKFVGGFVATPFAFGLMLPALNQWFAMSDSDDDRKKYGDNPYEQLPEYERRQNLCFYIGKGRFLKLPMAIEARAFLGLGDIAAGATSYPDLLGEQSLAEQIAMQFTQITPVDIMGGSKVGANSLAGSMLGAVTPSIFQPVIAAGIPGTRWGTNVSWMGTPVSRRSEWNKRDPNWQMGGEKTHEGYNKTARWLSDITGGDEVRGGWLDVDPAKLQYLLDSYGSGPAKDISETITFFDNLVKEDGKAEGGRVPVLKAVYRNASAANSRNTDKTRWYAYVDEEAQISHDLREYRKQGLTLKQRELRESAEGKRAKIVHDYKNTIKRLQTEKRNAKRRADREHFQELINEVISEAMEKIDKI